MRVGLFTPDRAFDMVTKAQIMKLKGPSVKLVDLVCQEVLGISRDIAVKVDSQEPLPGQLQTSRQTLTL